MFFDGDRYLCRIKVSLPEILGNFLRSVCVGNLSYNVTQDDLSTVFAESGAVRRVQLRTDRETGRPRGFAFVEMESDPEKLPLLRLLTGLNGWAVTYKSTNPDPVRKENLLVGFAELVVDSLGITELNLPEPCGLWCDRFTPVFAELRGKGLDRNKLEGNAIHAVTFTSRRGAVLKYVA